MSDHKIKVGVDLAASGKPGKTTTEFWTSILVQAGALLVVAVGLYKGNDMLVGFGSLLSGLTQGTYNVGRSMEKAGLAKAAVALFERAKEGPEEKPRG